MIYALVFAGSCLICLWIGYLAGTEVGFMTAMMNRRITIDDLHDTRGEVAGVSPE